MNITIFLNVTTHAEAHENGTEGRLGYSESHADSLAIFLRGHGDDESHARAGDRLRKIGSFEIDAASALAAAEVAYALGNGMHAQSEDYYSAAARVRSFSTGDIVVVDTPDGPAAFACESFGFSAVNFEDFRVEVSA